MPLASKFTDPSHVEKGFKKMGFATSYILFLDLLQHDIYFGMVDQKQVNVAITMKRIFYNKTSGQSKYDNISQLLVTQFAFLLIS